MRRRFTLQMQATPGPEHIHGCVKCGRKYVCTCRRTDELGLHIPTPLLCPQCRQAMVKGAA